MNSQERSARQEMQGIQLRQAREAGLHRRDSLIEEDRMLYPYVSLDERSEYISVISSAACGRIRISDIEVIEQEGRKTHIVTAEKDYAFYQRATDLIPALVGRAFYRPVKGLYINFDNVREISGTNIIFYSGQVVTLGRNSISRTRTAYKRYLMKYPPYSLWEGREASAAAAPRDEFHPEERKNA